MLIHTSAFWLHVILVQEVPFLKSSMNVPETCKCSMYCTENKIKIIAIDDK